MRRPIPILCLWSAASLAGTSCRSDDVAGPTPPHAVEGLQSTSGELLFREMSAVVGPTCGVTVSHRVYCWGYGVSGQLGGGKRFRDVSTSSFHACGIAMDRRAYCWGAGRLLGIGDTDDDYTTPVQVQGGFQFLKIDAGMFHTCGVTTTHRVYCWGYNWAGMIGDGTNIARSTPVLVAGGRRFISVSTGNGHTCAVTVAYRAFCWGSNNFGKLGNGSSVDMSLVPVPVTGSRSFRRLSSSWDHTCGVTLTNRAFCWGYGLNGAIGDGTLTTRNTPRAVVGGLSVAAIQAGAFHSCAITTAGRAYCWGDNEYGELGTGSTSNAEVLRPVAVAGGLRFTELSAGSYSTCGITPTRRAYCWGVTSGKIYTLPTPFSWPI